MGLRQSSLFGIVVGIGVAVLSLLALQRFSHKSPPLVERGAVLPEADGALRHVLLHWTPRADPILAPAYQDFLRAIDSSVKVTFVVPRGMTPKERGALASRFDSIDPTKSLAARATVIEVDGPITPWSKDRALVTVPSGRQPARLVVPAEPPDSWRERRNDWQSVTEVARQLAPRFAHEVAPFDFDAGDLMVGRGQLLIDTNLLEKNRRRGYASMKALGARLGEFFHMPVLTLGENWGDTPRHHLSMYMTTLTQNHVLVGDPTLGRAIVGDNWQPGERGIETGQLLAADFSPTTVQRFNNGATALAAHGFQVTRIPTVAFEDKTYLAYTNGVFEVRDQRRIAYLPNYDVPALDAAAYEVYRKLGWEVIPIRVRGLYPFHGTIGCVVNVLERT